ncbi:retrovirus-related pol polyprotein from transposon TNT 1-94 [Tanacetum coccineum]
MESKESKYLSSLALDELIGNLKVHEVVMEKDFEIYKGKKERIKSIAVKAKKESSDDETLTSGSDDEEYDMAKGKSDQTCFRCGDPSHLIGDCPKTSRNNDQKAFIGGSWSDSENDAEDKTNDETCLMAQSSNEVTLDSSCYSDNASSLDNDNMQIEYDSLCEISLKIINKNKILKTKRDIFEKEILELNKKIKKLKRSKEIKMACKSCNELKLENAKLKETQVKFVKFDKSANSLREMLNNQKLPSCKIGLGFDSDKASTSETKTMSFVGSSAEKVTDRYTIKGHGSTLPGSVSRKDSEKGTKYVVSPPMSSRSDFVITRKKLIHNSIDESKKPSLKPSLKSGIGYVKTESRSKTPPPRRNISSQPRYNTPQSRREILSNQLLSYFYSMNLESTNKIKALYIWEIQAHTSHKAKNMVSTKRCLELLHMDLFGPLAIKSYGGNLYTLVVVDDYSRYTWTRFLKTKNEAFEKFEILSNKIQNQLGSSIIAIRTDHGQEFDNEVQFRAYCDALGITHNFSAPRTPQSNGVVERKNRTLQEMSRTMLNEQSIPQKFWCNAVDTSTYILNRILIRPILGKTPYEIFKGRTPSLEYFKVFGSKCFILNTKDHLTNFDPKSYECVFLRYSQNSKAYVVLNKHPMKVEESLNVSFDESPPLTKLSPLVDDDVGEEEALEEFQNS